MRCWFGSSKSRKIYRKNEKRAEQLVLSLLSKKAVIIISLMVKWTLEKCSVYLIDVCSYFMVNYYPEYILLIGGNIAWQHL